MSKLSDYDLTLSLYSDLYKEVRGFRPRDIEDLSIEELDRRIQALDCEIQEILAEQAEDADPEAWKKYV